MKDAEAVTFAGGTLDRASQLRGDASAQAGLAADPRARCLPLWQGRPLLEGGTAAPARLAADGRGGLRGRRRHGFPRARGGGAAFRPRGRRLGRATGRGAAAIRRPVARPSPDPPRELRLRRPAGDDGHPRRGRGRHRGGGQGHPRLARHPPVLRHVRRAVRGRRRRLAPVLPRLRRPALPAHRPGRHHADPARQRRAPRPFRRLAARGCTRSSPASWSPASRSKERCAARSSRRPGCRSAGSTTCRASPGRSRRA